MRLLAVVFGLPGLFLAGFASAAVSWSTETPLLGYVTFAVILGITALAYLGYATRNFKLRTSDVLKGVLSVAQR